MRGSTGIGLWVHSLRHPVASIPISGAASLYIVGKALGHTQARTAERYAHLAQDPARVAAERVAARVAAGALERRCSYRVSTNDGNLVCASAFRCANANRSRLGARKR